MPTQERYQLSSKNLFDWIVAFCIFEIPLALFFLSISKESGPVHNWYYGNVVNIWNVIAQDSLYGFCGIIVALRVFDHLANRNVIQEHFLRFLLLLVVVQWLGDITFASIMTMWPDEKSTKWIRFFKEYIRTSGLYALFGDTIWITSWALTYYFVSNYIRGFDTKVFIVSFFFFMVSAYSET